jgi:transcriptional regulator with XRE-family HTH domain
MCEKVNIYINYVGNIEFFRDKLNMSDKLMCKEAGVSLSSYNDMKRRNSFSTKTLEKLAKALGVTVSDLVKDRSIDEKAAALNDMAEIKKKLDEFSQDLEEFEQTHLK